MKPEIDLSIIESALADRGEATARQIAADTGLEAKEVTHALNTLRNSAGVEREKRSNEYVYWLTTSANTRPSTTPRAAAVAVQALHTPGAPADITEQLRQARAEHLAMSQTIVEVCCAIGRDPAATTTGELSQLVRDHIDAQINRATAGLLSVIADIRKAIGDEAGRIMLGKLAEHISKDHDALRRDQNDFLTHLNAIYPITEELMGSYGACVSTAKAVQIMGMLIDAQAEQISAQATHITQLQDIDVRQNQQITELRGRVEAQILASVDSANSSSHLLTEVHDALTTGWPEALEAPTGRTTLQLAQAMIDNFNDLYAEYLDLSAPTPDVYIVTRNDTAVATRHKDPDAARRKAKAAIRAGACTAEIIAGTRIARAFRGAEIKPA